MKIVINIPKEKYQVIKTAMYARVGEETAKQLIKYIKNGKPLKQEPRKGEWQLTDDEMFIYCPFCHETEYERPIDASWKYCPDCGAKMV